MTRRRKLTWIYLLFCLPVFGQEISIVTNWDYKRSNDRYEKILNTISTTNGYVIAVGETFDKSIDEKDGLFIVLDAITGEKQVWKQLSRVGDQVLHDIVQNPDGTFTLVGYSKRAVKSQDGWVVRIDLSGEVIDEQYVDAGGNKADALYDLAINDQGEMIASGVKDLGKNSSEWLVKIDADGRAESLRTSIIGDGNIAGVAADQEAFVVVGNTSSKNKNHPNQIYVQKIDSNGEALWSEPKYFGDRGFQEASDISYAPMNGGYIVCGVTNSKGAGKSDMWMIKLDADGSQEWDKALGGSAGDVARSVIELSNGGYALFGQTWSHAITKLSNLRIYVTDNQGKVVDDNHYRIIDSDGDNVGYAITESAASNNIVWVGNSTKPNRQGYTATFLSSLNYYEVSLAELGEEEDETFGTTSGNGLDLSIGRFVDKNKNNYIEEGERGYVEVDVTNPGPVAKQNVVAHVSSTGSSDLKFWDKLFLGSIGAGQTKKLRVPVVAQDRPRSSNYRLELNIKSNGRHGASTAVDVASNTPNPADLIVNKSQFSPGSDPVPGEPIDLVIELANMGGEATSEVSAEFRLPPGVQSNGSERILLPAIAPRTKHEVTFSFTYQETFREDAIQIGFDVESTDKFVGPRKTFSLPVPQSQPLLAAVDDKPAPNSEILWVSHDTEEFRTIDVNKREVDLKVIALSNASMSKRNFAVLINGRRSQGQKLDEAKLSPPKNRSNNRIQQSYENTVTLTEGLNEVQIVYYSEDGSEVVGSSSPITFHYIPKGKPNLHVLSIGVQHSDLKYTVNDAKAIIDMYSKLGGDGTGSGFKKVFVNSMVDADVTTERGIKKAFLDLSRRRAIKEDDLVVVFISSHGKVIDGDRYVLLPSDYDPQYDEIGTVDFNEDILKRLRNVEGKKLVFIDACHSGSAGSRSYSNEAASKVMNDLINASAGLEIFASCSDREFSYEDDRWKHGAFTKAILEAFKNETVVIDGKEVSADIYKHVGGTKEAGSDGVITIEELKLFVQQRVPNLVKHVKNKPQHPTNKSTELLPKDMGIFMVLE